MSKGKSTLVPLRDILRLVVKRDLHGHLKAEPKQNPEVPMARRHLSQFAVSARNGSEKGMTEKKLGRRGGSAWGR